MAHAYQFKDAEHDDPEPTTLGRVAMVDKLTQCGIHADSPLGRGVLMGRGILADDSGKTFITPPPPPPPAPSEGSPPWAKRATEAPSASLTPASTSTISRSIEVYGRDIGDEVADELDRQLGRAPRALGSAPCAALAPAPKSHSASKDIGEAVADELERQLFGAVRGVRS